MTGICIVQGWLNHHIRACTDDGRLAVSSAVEIPNKNCSVKELKFLK
jgi:hypothetical protein